MTSLDYPPGPHSILPNKLFRQFMRDPIKTLTDIANTYGNICHFKFGRQHIYLLNNPEYIEGILIRDHKNFIKSRGLQVSKRLLGEGLVTSEGEYHDRQRRLIQPTFHPNRIKGYGDIMTSHAVRMQERWKDGSTLDIHKEMMHVTSEIISKAVLGSDIKAEEDEVGVALQTCMEYFNRLQMPFGELIEKIPILHINKGYQSAKKKLDSIVYSMIKEHRDNETKGVYHKEDLLYTLLQAQDTEAGIGRMTDLQLKDEVMTIFLAGHETTSNAFTWTFYLLSQHPTADDRLYAELCSVLGDKDAKRIPTVEDIPKLEYTEKVLRESMRLYPPAWTLGRKAINDYKVDKYVIPAGSIILMSQYIMHHDSRYFSDPDTFYPDRWTKEARLHLPRFSYFPFGGGIRGCVGEPFAWMEGILLLATICRHWKMHHDRDHKVGLKPLITLRPKYGMRMELESRI
ncbi:MAG: cytochrome P450 [Candidatus Nitrosopolaris sp.]|jgi:cytochrome P450